MFRILSHVTIQPFLILQPVIRKSYAIWIRLMNHSNNKFYLSLSDVHVKISDKSSVFLKFMKIKSLSQLTDVNLVKDLQQSYFCDKSYFNWKILMFHCETNFDLFLFFFSAVWLKIEVHLYIKLKRHFFCCLHWHSYCLPLVTPLISL